MQSSDIKEDYDNPESSQVQLKWVVVKITNASDDDTYVVNGYDENLDHDSVNNGDDNIKPGLKKIESPKSIALRGDPSPLLEKRKFSGFKSRCMTPKE